MPSRKQSPYYYLYNTRRWRRRSRHQLKTSPMCVLCLAEGEYTAATVSDHVVPHKGDEQLFWFGELQSLCADHHAGTKQRLEKRGYDTKVGVDGWPVDPRHPANLKHQPFGPRPTYAYDEPSPRIDVVSRLMP